MTLIQHPDHFADGVRVLLVVNRNKDGSAEGNKTRRYVSRDVDEFRSLTEKLYDAKEEGQRVYASASPRDVDKAIRAFRQAQLDNDYSDSPSGFYLHVESRWKTALMQKQCEVKSRKLWLIDCDTEDEFNFAQEQLERFYEPDEYYEYNTKNGFHVMIQPFNTSACDPAFNKLVQKNAMMLWAY